MFISSLKSLRILHWLQDNFPYYLFVLFTSTSYKALCNSATSVDKLFEHTLVYASSSKHAIASFHNVHPLILVSLFQNPEMSLPFCNSLPVPSLRKSITYSSIQHYAIFII